MHFFFEIIFYTFFFWEMLQVTFVKKQKTNKNKKDKNKKQMCKRNEEET